MYGKALAAVLTEALGIPVEALATQGTDQNMLLIDSGDAQLGFVTTGTALQGWNGSGAWTLGKQLRSMRALFPMYDTPIHFLALKSSGIGSLRDMADKRVGAGPQGGTAGTYAQKIFDTLSISTALRFGAWNTLERAAALRLSSMLLSARLGSRSQSLPNSTDRGNPLRPARRRRNRQAARGDPELSASVVAAGIYPSLKIDYETIGL